MPVEYKRKHFIGCLFFFHLTPKTIWVQRKRYIESDAANWVFWEQRKLVAKTK